jgi:hypothetical protein
VTASAAQPIVVQFYRWDRESDLDPGLELSAKPEEYRLFEHSYGDDIDRLVDELAGPDQPLDRSIDWPTATLPDSEVVMVLHEDGPTFQLILEQLPAFVSAATGLFSAWVAWRSKKPTEAGQVEPRRTARIEIGGHRYEGPVRNVEDLEALVRTLAAMESEGDSAP